MRSLSGVINKKLTQHRPKPREIVSPLNKDRVMDIINYLITSKEITPTLMKAYISMVRSYCEKWTNQELRPLKEEKNVEKYLS